MYRIRPAENFFNVDYSLAAAANAATSEAEGNYLPARILDYGGMNEYVARGGFSYDRIMSVIYVDAATLNDISYNPDGDPHDDAASWGWHPIHDENTTYPGAMANTNPYPNVSHATGIMQVTVNETTGARTPLRLSTCYVSTPVGPSSYFSSSPGIAVGKRTCPAKQAFASKSIIYGTPLILAITASGEN